MVKPESEAASLVKPACVLGLGCRQGTEPGELILLAESGLRTAAIVMHAVTAVASIDRKSADAAVEAVAHHFGVPALYFDADALERETPRLLNPSDAVFAAIGCHGVAEAAALAAAGPASWLVLPKTAAGGATVAIALAD